MYCFFDNNLCFPYCVHLVLGSFHMKGKTNSGHNNNDWGADVKYKVKAKIEGHDSGSKLKVSIKVSMKRKFLFDIFFCLYRYNFSADMPVSDLSIPISIQH